jgi:hypothetical protein
MANVYNANTDPKIKYLLQGILQATGTTDVDLSGSASFKAVLETRDGKNLSVKVIPLDQGVCHSTVKVTGTDLVVPSGGTADFDGAYGTAVMVASTITVTVPVPDVGVAVPTGSLVYASVTTPGGNTKRLVAVRASDTQITISSAGSGYNNLLESAAVDATLIAGTKTFALANVVGDRLVAVEKTAGGGAAAYFGILRSSDANVIVNAQSADKSFAVTNTSVVTAYNFGQAAHETSTVRWVVIRP